MEEQKQNLSSDILEEMRELRHENVGFQDRLSRIEAALYSLLGYAKISNPTASPEKTYDNIDQFITDQIEHNLAEQEASERDLTDGKAPEVPEEENWDFFVAQKGGFDEVLYMTVQDFLGFGAKDPAKLVGFLTQKRDKEVTESFQHLCAEYENLDGNQLQSHFTQLWQLHHNLLKKKIIRTWKEEIFLEAFNQFINWLQK